jgi:hypothetical protein
LQECSITIVENGAAREAHLTDPVTPSITGFYFQRRRCNPGRIVEDRGRHAR